MLAPAPESLAAGSGGAAEPAAPPRQRQEPAEDLVYLSARVPKALRAEFQHQAIREDRSVRELLQDAVRAYLDQHAGT